MRRYYAEDGYGFSDADARAAMLKPLQQRDRGRVWVVADEASVVGYFLSTLGDSLQSARISATTERLLAAWNPVPRTSSTSRPTESELPPFVDTPRAASAR